MDLRHWQKVLKEAERELEAATRLTDVNAAASKLMGARTALKRLKMSQPIRRLFRQAGVSALPIRRSSRDAGSAGASS